MRTYTENSSEKIAYFRCCLLKNSTSPSNKMTTAVVLPLVKLKLTGGRGNLGVLENYYLLHLGKGRL